MRNTITYLFFMVFFCSTAIVTAQEYGVASYYSDAFHGRKTASGELYDKNRMTGAHKTLPFGTVIRVTRIDNNQSVEVRINDRGPYIKGRIVDISGVAAKRLDIVNAGTAEVKLEILNKKSSAPIVVTKPKIPPVEMEEFTAKSIEKPIKPVVKETVKEVNKKPIPKPSVPKVKPKTTTTPKEHTTAPKTQTLKSSSVAKRVRSKDYKTFDLYKVQILRPQREGFGVQVASYTQYENVMKQVAELQEKWFNNILISVEQGKDKEAIYKILLGPFPSKKIAGSYKKELKKKKKITGFIVDLGTIKY